MSLINSMNVGQDEKKNKKNKKNKKKENPFSGISLCVIGRSGTGKTALMAKLATITRAANDQRPVIIRFCGTSKGSVNGLALVQSLCHQIQLVLQLSPQPVPSYYENAVLMLHSLLNQHAIVLFIDRLAIYPLKLPFQPTLSTKYLYVNAMYLTQSQYTFSTHPINTLCQPTL